VPGDGKPPEPVAREAELVVPVADADAKPPVDQRFEDTLIVRPERVRKARASTGDVEVDAMIASIERQSRWRVVYVAAIVAAIGAAIGWMIGGDRAPEPIVMQPVKQRAPAEAPPAVEPPELVEAKPPVVEARPPEVEAKPVEVVEARPPAAEANPVGVVEAKPPVAEANPVEVVEAKPPEAVEPEPREVSPLQVELQAPPARRPKRPARTRPKSRPAKQKPQAPILFDGEDL